jgi:hypothetical protein
VDKAVPQQIIEGTPSTSTPSVQKGQPKRRRDSDPPAKQGSPSKPDPRPKRIKKTPEARVLPPRVAKQKAPEQPEINSDLELEEMSHPAKKQAAPPPTPPPPYAIQPPPSVEETRIALRFHNLANALLDQARQPTTLRQFVPNDTDPFYALFSRSFRYPSGPLQYPRSYYVTLTFDEFLPYNRLPELLPDGFEPYVMLSAWVAGLRGKPDWTTADTGVILPRLEAILNILKAHPRRSSAHPSHGGKSLRMPPPQPPLSRSPSPTSSQVDDTAQLKDITGDQPDPDDRRPSPTPEPEMSTLLPPDAEKAVSRIERLGEKQSSIPQGLPTESICNYFRGQFSFDNDDRDDVLYALNSSLDAVIGADTLKEHLRLGPFGLDGLLRGWYARSRKFFGWYPYLDEIIVAKLHGIAKFIEDRVINPPANSPLSTPLPNQTLEPPPQELKTSQEINTSQASDPPVAQQLEQESATGSSNDDLVSTTLPAHPVGQSSTVSPKAPITSAPKDLRTSQPAASSVPSAAF